MGKINFIIICILLVIIVNTCKSSPKTDSAEKYKIILEAEDFTLKDCLIVTNPKASQGKAVKIEQSTSEGAKDIILQKGEYIMQIVIFALNNEQDTLKIRIGPHEIKAYTKNFNEFNYCRVFLDFPIKEKAGQPIQVSFVALKTLMLIDKIEIVKKSKWTNPFK